MTTRITCFVGTNPAQRFWLDAYHTVNGKRQWSLFRSGEPAFDDVLSSASRWALTRAPAGGSVIFTFLERT